jgi:hypothetical protein
MRRRLFFAALALALAALPGGGTAKEKAKREKATVALPIIVEAPAATQAGRLHSFRTGEMWGTQPARYRSAVAVDGLVRETGGGAPLAILPGERLVELQATSRAFTGPLYCKTVRMGGKQWPALACLADRDDDGAFDQLWTGRAASLDAVVPYPDIRSLTAIEPVRFRPLTDPASLALEIGFYVSGKNPLLGQHHFYAGIAVAGKVAYLFGSSHEAVTLSELPKPVGLIGARISVKSLVKGTYQAEVVQPVPSGEQMVVSPYPKQTVYVYVPG